MLGGAILLTKCDPADIESASAAGHLDHMIRSRYLRDAKYSTTFDRCSIEMLQQTRTGVKAGVIVAVHAGERSDTWLNMRLSHRRFLCSIPLFDIGLPPIWARFLPTEPLQGSVVSSEVKMGIGDGVPF